MRNCLKTIISISAVVSVLGLNSSVFGVAAFARQTGLDCTSCHASVGFPTLNTFGQSFKAGGMINGDDANMMGDGEALSIPKALNGTIVVKIRGAKIDETKSTLNAATGLQDQSKSASKYELDMPDEWAFLFGGRAAKNVGYLVEYGGKGTDLGALSFKMPIVFDLAGGKLGVVPFWTDGLGAGYGFEQLSTGAVRNIRAAEERTVISALNFVEDRLDADVGGTGNTTTQGLASGASGITAYYWMGMGHIAVTGYAPASTNAAGTVQDVRFANYIRAAVTPSVAGLDIAVGVQKALGAAAIGGIGEGIENDYLGVDAQVMGNLGLPVALFVSYGSGTNTTVKGKDVAGTEASAITFFGDAQIIENLLNIGAGMRLGTVTAVDPTLATKKFVDYSDNAIVVEVKYNLARNVRLSADYSKQLGDVFKETASTTTLDAPESRSSKARVMVFGSF